MARALIAIPLLICRAAALILATEPTTQNSKDSPAAAQSTVRSLADAGRPATVKVAAIQCPSDIGDIAGNSKRLTALVETAAKEGAKIVVLPEASVTGYLSQDLQTNWRVPGKPMDATYISGKDPAAFAQPVPGPATDEFGMLAARLQIYLTVPLVEKVNPPVITGQVRYFNTIALLNPQGKIVAHYRKLHPWPVPEKSWATPGDLGLQTYDTEYGRVALAICFDIHETVPQYKDKGVWVLLYPIAWVDAEHPADWFWHQLPTRARQFNFWIIGANWSVDHAQKWRGYGFSSIISPEGEVAATAKSLYGNEIVYATIPTQKR